MRHQRRFEARKTAPGMTLIELLVVLIIIGILGAVTLRAMDTTREKANYDRTMKTMERLAHAIAGNPNLVADGRRTDFGFVGDLGRLPSSLEELRVNLNGDSAWNGPYVRVPFDADVMSFRMDAWGRELQYLASTGEIISLGNGSNPITYRVVDDTAALFRNSLAGTITDNQGNPPGVLASNLRVHLWLRDPVTGQPYHIDTIPNADGHYDFEPRSRFRIPVGNHRLTVVRLGGAGESLTKWVTVAPRVGAIVDFRLVTPFVGALRLIGGSEVAYASGGGDSANNVTFNVINTGSDTIRLDSIMFVGGDTAYCESLRLRRQHKWSWDLGGLRAGVNDSVAMTFPGLPELVPGTAMLNVDLRRFYNVRVGPGVPVNMHNKTIRLRFSDGSFVEVRTQ